MINQHFQQVAGVCLGFAITTDLQAKQLQMRRTLLNDRDPRKALGLRNLPTLVDGFELNPIDIGWPPSVLAGPALRC